MTVKVIDTRDGSVEWEQVADKVEVTEDGRFHITTFYSDPVHDDDLDYDEFGLAHHQKLVVEP